MKKCVFCILVFTFLTLSFCSVCSAAEDTAEDYLEQFYDIFGTESELSEEIGVEALLSEIVSSFSGGGDILAFSAFVLGAVIVIALASLLCESRYAAAAATALAVIGIYGKIYGLVESAVAALSEMSEMFSALIPIAAGVTLAGGGVNGAAAEAAAMGTVFGAVSGIFLPILLPLVAFMLALCVCASLGGGEIRSLFLRARSLFMWLLGIVSAVLMGGIALQGVICSARDSAAMRIAKYSASGLLPVIGGTVSASLSSLAAGLSYAKSVIGAQAIYVFLTLAVAPLLMMLLYRAILSVGGGLLSFLGVGEGGGGLSYLCFSLDALISVYGVSVLLYIFEVIMFMKSGVAIL